MRGCSRARVSSAGGTIPQKDICTYKDNPNREEE